MNNPASQANTGTAKIVMPELSINKKLGNIKFNQIFDSKDLSNAENIVGKSQDLFKAETIKDFQELKAYFQKLNADAMSKNNYEVLSDFAFSIKGRAGTGGFPLASDVANPMYQFCDKAAETLPANGYRIVEIHFNALDEIFSGKFDITDTAKSQKLVMGLNELVKKFAG